MTEMSCHFSPCPNVGNLKLRPNPIWQQSSPLDFLHCINYSGGWWHYDYSYKEHVNSSPGATLAPSQDEGWDQRQLPVCGHQSPASRPLQPGETCGDLLTGSVLKVNIAIVTR